jgi:hypothetical protein
MNGYSNGTSTHTGPVVVTGHVAAVNASGFKFVGGDSWLNWSRFATDPTKPRTGDEVRVTLDKQGFVRSVQIVDDAPAARQEPAHGATKDQQIARMNALTHAVAIVTASTPAELVTVAQVLEAAEAIERWILR